MYKKSSIIKVILLFLIIITFNTSVFASTIDVKLSKQVINKSDKFNITVKCNVKVTDFEVEIVIPHCNMSVKNKFKESTESIKSNSTIVKYFQFASQNNKKEISAGTKLVEMSCQMDNSYRENSVDILVSIKAVDKLGRKIEEQITQTIKTNENTVKNETSNVINIKEKEEKIDNTNVEFIPEKDDNMGNNTIEEIAVYKQTEDIVTDSKNYIWIVFIIFVFVIGIIIKISKHIKNRNTL